MSRWDHRCANVVKIASPFLKPFATVTLENPQRESKTVSLEIKGEGKGGEKKRMVFKGRFFSSKKSDSSSPDGSNSPKTPTFESPTSSEKKKVKSDPAVGRHSLIRDAVKRYRKKEDKKDRGRDSKGKETAAAAAAPLSAPSKLRKGGAVAKDGGAAASELSPIHASSLGLNRIKTRSGPLPQEGFRGNDRISGLDSSNLSRDHVGGGCSTSSSAGKGGGGSASKDGRALDKASESCASSWADHGKSRAKERQTTSLDARLGSLSRKDKPSDVRIGKMTGLMPFIC